MAQAKSKSELTYEVAIPNKEKRFKELIIYISDKCSNDPTFGATKINKLLWCVDFLSYLKKGKPITGEKYQRLEHGPAPVRLKPIRNEMISKGEIILRAMEYHGKMQHRIIALRNADLSLFTGDEIALVDSIIDAFRSKNATEISNWSHGRAWKTRYDGDPIPYEAAYLSDDPIDAADISRTEELAKTLGWEKHVRTESRPNT